MPLSIVYHGSFIKFVPKGAARNICVPSGSITPRSTPRIICILPSGTWISIIVATAKLDDMLGVETSVTACGNTSITMDQVVSREGKVLAQLKVTVVGITPEGRPARIPPQLRQILLASSPLAEGIARGRYNGSFWLRL